MKYYLLFLFSCIILLQCETSKDEQLKGTWMNITPDVFNIHSSVIKFYDNYYVYKSETNPIWESEERVNFTTKENKLYAGDDDLRFNEVFRFTIEKDTLKLFDVVTDSLAFYFIRFEYTNILHYYNTKYNINIMLPNVGELEYRARIMDDTGDNVFLMDYSNDTITLYCNGNKTSLDTLLHKKILPDDYSDEFRFNHCVFHKSIPYFYVRAIKKEISKASYFRIAYATSDENDILYELPSRLPSLEQDLSKNRQINCFLFEICKNKLLHHDAEISEDKLIEKLINSIKSSPEATCEFYVHDDVLYGDYIYMLNNIVNTYRKVRNDYAKEKYGVEDYRSLDEDTEEDIRERIPMNFVELWDK